MKKSSSAFIYLRISALVKIFSGKNGRMCPEPRSEPAILGSKIRPARSERLKAQLVVEVDSQNEKQ